MTDLPPPLVLRTSIVADHRFREARILQRLDNELVGLIDELSRDRLRREREISCATGRGGSRS